MDHPLFEKRKGFLFYLFIWILISSIHFYLLITKYNIGVSYALADSIVHNFIFALIGMSLWYPMDYIKIEQDNNFWQFGRLAIAGIIIVLFWLFLSRGLINLIVIPKDRIPGFFKETIQWRLVTGFLYFFLITLIYNLFINFKNLREKNLKEIELKSLVTETELKSLKAQINPHFLFNSLNSISALTLISPDKAHEMIIKLSDFIRYSLKNRDQQFTLLKEEMENIKKYLDIEKIRFGQRLTINYSVSDECMEAKIPHLILQPLFENAIKYGIYENLDENIIEVKCKKHSLYTEFVISNTFDEKSASKKGEGLGLSNVRKRLQITFNQPDLLITQIDGNVFIATLKFPSYA